MLLFFVCFCFCYLYFFLFVFVSFFCVVFFLRRCFVGVLKFWGFLRDKENGSQLVKQVLGCRESMCFLVGYMFPDVPSVWACGQGRHHLNRSPTSLLLSEPQGENHVKPRLYLGQSWVFPGNMWFLSKKTQVSPRNITVLLFPIPKSG